MIITCQHVDTCTSDYLIDHHGRDGECLIGIPIYGQTAEQAARDLLEELDRVDFPHLDAVSDEVLRAALRGVDLRPFDEEGNRVREADVPHEVWETILDECESQAWFLLTWRSET